MASNYVEINDQTEEQLHSQYEHHHHLNQSPSPRSFKRQWSSGSAGESAAPPKCVCAPATHANSFKCRLHRSASAGGQSAAVPPPAPMRPPPSHSVSSASRTVEAL